MVQFLSINLFSWIFSIFVEFPQKFPFFCVTLCKSKVMEKRRRKCEEENDFGDL